jgi:hypothetical protein
LQSTSEHGKTPKDYKSEVILNAEALSSDHVSDVKTGLLISRLIHEEIVHRKQAGLCDLGEDDAIGIVSRVISEDMTMEERKLSSFTRRNLKTLPPEQWNFWREAYFTQLDSHCQDQVFGEPCKRPPGAIVLRSHWANIVKPGGKRKARLCADGSRRAAPTLRTLANTYSSCIEQPCMRLFFALASARGYYIRSADCTNAYMQAPAPSSQTYLTIDEAYSDWYEARFGKKLDPSLVLPIQKALQGHPEAGALWERHIVSILTGPELNLRSTTQERNLYIGTFNDEPILICRMVDDFSVAAPSAATTEAFIAFIASKGITIRDDGLLTKFNGVDLLQTRDYVKLSCTSFIERMLLSHGWEIPGAQETDSSHSIPMSPDHRDTLQRADPGPIDGTPAHKLLEKEMRFSYRQVLGELMYAYVVGRLDIGYCVTSLARYSDAPTKKHYDALRQVCRYLRATKDWGIIYWRSVPRHDLPSVPFPLEVPDPDLPDFPRESDPFRLVGYLDASHATDLKTRRSITGIIFCLAGGAIAFKSKLQATVATSSTEAEFVASVQAAKMARYLRSILLELGHPQSAPTTLHCDNKSAIEMVNQDRPTERSRHIDIAFFAIQSWRKLGDIHLQHIPGVINPSDAATKPLPWTLHHRHVRRSMGHYAFP